MDFAVCVGGWVCVGWSWLVTEERGWAWHVERIRVLRVCEIYVYEIRGCGSVVRGFSEFQTFQAVQ